MHVRIDNFSKHRRFGKGYMKTGLLRVEDINKMREFEILRGFFSSNRLAYLTGKLSVFTRSFFHFIGYEEPRVRELIKQKLRSNSVLGALFAGLILYSSKLFLKILRRLYIWEYISHNDPLYQTILPVETNYINFRGKQFFDLNVRDVWRPSVVTGPNEIITAEITPHANSELRLSFALLENVDPEVFNCEWKVKISCKLSDNGNLQESTFYAPILNETDVIEYEKNPLWLDFSIDLRQYIGKKVRLDLVADFKNVSEPRNNRRNEQPVYTQGFGWGAPQIITKKEAGEARKILFISMESMTDPFYISDNYEVEKGNLFDFLHEEEWHVFSHSYSQSDGTLGTASSFLTGLTALQHGIFDYGKPFWSKYGPVWNQKLISVAQLLKGKGFFTHLIGPSAFSGHIGCSRGIDSHFSYYSIHDIEHSDFEWLMQSWDMASSSDAFILMHYDRLHKPYVHHSTLRRRVYPLRELDGSITPVQLFMYQMEELDLQLNRILNFLRETGQYENTMIIITGDHGGSYNWKKRQAYSLYEDRTRVPLWIKMPVWSAKPHNKTDEPTNASILPFQIILKSLDIPLPEYFCEVPQMTGEFLGIAISHSITHPTYKDFMIALTDSGFKYIKAMKVDWLNNTVRSVESEILQPLSYASKDTNLTGNFSSDFPDEYSRLKELGDLYVQSSFDFRSKYPINIPFK
jgi:hypothetical protein